MSRLAQIFRTLERADSLRYSANLSVPTRSGLQASARVPHRADFPKTWFSENEEMKLMRQFTCNRKNSFSENEVFGRSERGDALRFSVALRGSTRSDIPNIWACRLPQIFRKSERADSLGFSENLSASTRSDIPKI